MDDPFNWVMVLGVIAAIVIAAEQYYSRNLPDPEFRRAKATALRDPGPWRLYLRGLDGSLDWLQRRMGHPLGIRAFGICLTVGLGYGFVFLVVAWGLGAPAALQDTVLLPELAQPWRALLAVSILVWLAGIVWLAVQAEKVDRAVLGWLGRRLGAAPDGWPARVSFGLLAGVVAAALLVGVRWLVTGRLISSAAEGGAIFLFVVVVVAVAVAVAGAVAGAAAGAVAVAAAIMLMAFVGRINNPVLLALVLFYLLLPAVNAVWDWLSWWVSRWLGRSLHELLTTSASGLWTAMLAVGHVVLDLLAAAVFLGLLALTLPLAIDGFNALAGWWQDVPPPLPLQGFLCASARAPLGAGLWATLLLFSTLVPTALHLAAVIASPVAAAATHIPAVHALADTLEAENPSHLTLLRAAWMLALWRPVAYLVGLAFAIALLWGLFGVIGCLAEPMPEVLLTLALRDSDAAARCLATLPPPAALLPG